MPTSKRKAVGRGYSVPAPVDLLRDGEMPSHLFLFHSYWTGTGDNDPAELKSFHELVHQDAEKANGKGMRPHTHSEPKPRPEFNW
jgi:hypothetical protein